jgi:hypothetical protein
MGTSLGDRAVRIAVKDAVTNRRLLAHLERAYRSNPSSAALPADADG